MVHHLSSWGLEEAQFWKPGFWGAGQEDDEFTFIYIEFQVSWGYS